MVWASPHFTALFYTGNSTNRKTGSLARVAVWASIETIRRTGWRNLRGFLLISAALWLVVWRLKIAKQKED